jgi:hypothetical protein
MLVSTSHREQIRDGHLSESDHDAWLIHKGCTVNEEALGRYFSWSFSVFLPSVPPQMLMLTVRPSNTNTVQSQEMRTSLHNPLEYTTPKDLKKLSIQRRSNANRCIF